MSNNVLEGQLVDNLELLSDDSPIQLKDTIDLPILNKTPNSNVDINVRRRVAELGCNPIDTLIYISLGDKDSLGVEEEIRVFERRAAAQELLSYLLPKIKAKDAEVSEEDMPKPIPEYVLKRGVIDRDTEAQASISKLD